MTMEGKSKEEMKKENRRRRRKIKVDETMTKNSKENKGQMCLLSRKGRLQGN